MAKRRRRTTSRSIKKHWANGHGQGRGKKYKSWLRIQDVASLGLVTRIKGWKTGRVHHLLSLLELAFFYTLDWALNVVDIREQYPLWPLEETIAISMQCGITYPVDPKTKHPIVMTTDFIITVEQDGKLVELARTVKYASDLQSKRTMQKLEIERRFFQKKGISWGIVTEKDIPKALAKNVEWLHPYREASLFTDLSEDEIRQIAAVLTEMVVQQNKSLRCITLECDNKLGLEPGTSLSIVRHLLATRCWQIDMNKPINPCERLILIVPRSA